MRIRLVRHRPREERLPRAGRAVEEDPLRRGDADLLEEVRLCQGELDRFPDLLDLRFKAADVLVGLLRRLHQFHAVDLRVVARGEHIDDGEGLLVECAPHARFEEIGVDKLRCTDQEPRPCAASYNHPVVVDNVGNRSDHKRRAPELLDLALELSQLPLVADLLSLDISFFGLHLAELFA